MIITVVIFIRLGEMTKLPIIEGIAIAKKYPEAACCDANSTQKSDEEPIAFIL